MLFQFQRFKKNSTTHFSLVWKVKAVQKQNTTCAKHEVLSMVLVLWNGGDQTKGTQQKSEAMTNVKN